MVTSTIRATSLNSWNLLGRIFPYVLAWLRVGTSKQHSSIDVARSLIWLAAQEDRDIDSFTLAKLLYKVQARALVLRGTPFLDEPIRSYRDGPIAERAWRKFRQSEDGGKAPIPRAEGATALVGAELALVAAVWDDFKGLTYDEWYKLVHDEEPLWSAHPARYHDGAWDSPIIPDDEIREYHKAISPAYMDSKALAAHIDNNPPSDSWLDEPSPFPE